jgi:CubicO group peptidase (beta-lactamase class C family)
MTKIATATAVVRLHPQGVVDLDAPVDHYLSYDSGLVGARPCGSSLNHTARRRPRRR